MQLLLRQSVLKRLKPKKGEGESPKGDGAPGRGAQRGTSKKVWEKSLIHGGGHILKCLSEGRVFHG